MQKQDKQANSNNTAQMKDEQTNTKDVRNQPHADQPQMKNEQRRQFQPHARNIQRTNNRR